MNKKLVAVVAAVLVLAGCSAAPNDDGAEAPDTSSQRSAPVETNSPAEPELTAEETELLSYLNSERLERVTPGVTDEQLLSAAWAACDQFSQGIAWADIKVIEADADNVANSEIANLASQTICTEYDVTVTG